MGNPEMVCAIWWDVYGLYANTVPFHPRDLESHGLQYPRRVLDSTSGFRLVKVMLNEASDVDFHYLIRYSLSGLFRRIKPALSM